MEILRTIRLLLKFTIFLPFSVLKVFLAVSWWVIDGDDVFIKAFFGNMFK